MLFGPCSSFLFNVCSLLCSTAHSRSISLSPLSLFYSFFLSWLFFFRDPFTTGALLTRLSVLRLRLVLLPFGQFFRSPICSVFLAQCVMRCCFSPQCPIRRFSNLIGSFVSVYVVFGGCSSFWRYSIPVVARSSSSYRYAHFYDCVAFVGSYFLSILVLEKSFAPCSYICC